MTGIQAVQEDQMGTRITVISDNTPYAGLPGEWGLSLYVEHEDVRILTDAGASGLFAQNMEQLGLDIGKVDHAVLSHAHYDHSDGMPVFFEKNEKARLYIRDTAAEDCYHIKHFLPKYIGVTRHMLSRYADRIEKVTGDFRLCDGAWLIPHKTGGLERIGIRERMYRKRGLIWRPDDFSHEQSLVLDTVKGLVIINSCSHGGVVNIIREVRDTFPGREVYGIIGGFHLFNKTDEEVRVAAEAIRDTGIGFVCTGHCTGERACNILKSELNERFSQLHVGLVLEF